MDNAEGFSIIAGIRRDNNSSQTPELSSDEKLTQAIIKLKTVLNTPIINIMLGAIILKIIFMFLGI